MPKDPRFYVGLDVGFLDNPKAIAAGVEGRALWVGALTWSGQQLSDGLVPRDAMPLVAFKALGRTDVDGVISRLVEVGMFEAVTRDSAVTCDTCDSPAFGWRVHDYLEHQTSAAEVAEKRAANVDRQRKSRDHRKDVLAEHQARGNKSAVTRESRVTNGAVTRDKGVTVLSRGGHAVIEVEVERESSKEDSSRVPFEICELIAQKWAEFTKARDLPKVTAQAVNEVRLLMTRGSTEWAKPREIPEAEVRRVIDLTFEHGTSPWGRDGQSWARLLKTGTSLRKYWPRLVDIKPPNNPAHRAEVADRSLSSNGQGSYVEAELAEARERGRQIKEMEQ